MAAEAEQEKVVELSEKGIGGERKFMKNSLDEMASELLRERKAYVLGQVKKNENDEEVVEPIVVDGACMRTPDEDIKWAEEQAELEALQSAAAAGLTPSGAGRSRRALFALRGDPSAGPALSPIVRWATEVWHASLPYSSRALSIQFLRDSWDMVQPHAITKWGLVRGPMTAAAMSAARIGWDVSQPFVENGPRGHDQSHSE